jgi:hypothetical protein
MLVGSLGLLVALFRRFVELNLVDTSAELHHLGAIDYCRISFNSARVVTRDTDSALRQPTDFGVTPPKIRHSRRKISKILPFLHKGDLAPMSHIVLGAVTRDRDQNLSRHRGA